MCGNPAVLTKVHMWPAVVCLSVLHCSLFSAGYWIVGFQLSVYHWEEAILDSSLYVFEKL